MSAIKNTLVNDKYEWNDDLVLVRALSRACRLVNDCVRTRLPINCSLLEMILFEVQRYFREKKQYYLEIMYKALFALSYYGLMRVGETTKSPHVLKAKNVFLGENKDNVLLILDSSKTHDESTRPQRIKITANNIEKSGRYLNRHFCPFKLINKFMKIRPGYTTDDEQLFVFSDGSPVTPLQVSTVLKLMIKNLNKDEKLYGMHSFRIGRTTDLIKYNYSIEEVKLMGRWTSNIIYKYIRDFG